jgi:hypothetical protein
MHLAYYRRIRSGEKVEYTDTEEFLDSGVLVCELLNYVDATAPSETYKDIVPVLWRMLRKDGQRRAIAIEKEASADAWLWLQLFSWRRARVYVALALLALRPVLPFRWFVPLRELEVVVEYLYAEA